MFKAANEWVSRRLAQNRERRNGVVSIVPSGIQRAWDDRTEIVGWGDIVQVEAILLDAYIGDNLGLVIQSRDGRMLQVLEYDPAWRALCSALEEQLPGAAPYAEWSLKTAFGNESRRFRVYPCSR